VRVIAIILCAGLLTACAKTWDKPGATEAEFNRDSYECQRDARMAHGSFGGGLAGQFYMMGFAEQCMGARGWNPRKG
jgi:hypothetical protein